MRKLVTGGAFALGAIVIVAVATVTPALAGAGPLPEDVQRVRAATERYASLEQALRAGYSIEGEPCVASPAGGMGVHAVNFALIADPAIDPLQPEILLYAPNENGKLKLVGVEYFSVDADQNVATDGDRPSLFGQAFDGPMPGHSPTMPVHYDLHVWTSEQNANGLFAMWNPAVSC